MKVLSDKVLLRQKKDVLRWHLYGKLLQNGIRPFENDIDILLELYLFGGYENTQEQAAFIRQCLDKKFRKAPQSVRNTLSKYTTLKVLHKPKNRSLRLSDDFLPVIPCDKLIINHFISHND